MMICPWAHAPPLVDCAGNTAVTPEVDLVVNQDPPSWKENSFVHVPLLRYIRQLCSLVLLIVNGQLSTASYYVIPFKARNLATSIVIAEMTCRSTAMACSICSTDFSLSPAQAIKQ